MSLLEPEPPLVDIGILRIADSPRRMQDNASFLFIDNCITLGCDYSSLSSLLEHYISQRRNSHFTLRSYYYTLILRVSSLIFVVVNFSRLMLTVESVVTDSEKQLVFQSVQQFLGNIPSRTLFVDNNSPILPILQSVSSDSLFNIPNFFVIDIIKLSVG